jgi:hypothetical protein
VYEKIRANFGLPPNFTFDYVYILLGKEEIHGLFEGDSVFRGSLPFDFHTGTVNQLVRLLEDRVEGLCNAFRVVGEEVIVAYGTDPGFVKPVRGLAQGVERSTICGSTSLSQITGPDFADYWSSVWESRVHSMIRRGTVDFESPIPLPFSRYPSDGLMGSNWVMPMPAMIMYQRDLYNNLTRLWLRGMEGGVNRYYVSCAGVPESPSASGEFVPGIPPWRKHEHACGTKCQVIASGTKYNFGNFQSCSAMWKFNVTGEALPRWREEPGFRS